MDIVFLVSALIRLALQNNIYRQLEPKVMIKQRGFSSDFFFCVSLLLSDYDSFIENKTCLTQALSNHASFYVRRQSLF